MLKRHFLHLAFGIAALIGLAAPANAQPEKKPLLVYAASSLTDALNQAADAYAAAGRVRPTLSYAASSTLARQIEQGARADLFISADEDWMNYLAERKLIEPATRVSILSNKLVLVAPADRPLKVKIAPGFDLNGALAGGKLAMADPESVPAGKYGRAALQALGAWNAVEADVARAENVRAALRFVETGDAAAGIVYFTDARASGDKVVIVGEFPQSSFPKISYPLAAIKGGQSEEAKAFAAFLRGPKAQAIFRSQGFITP
ncbi:MAG TPA: molybdate ABC transporter substrate-binding protein [Caulobacterales bacterium]|nr:molybdate ABC transporter substrate-binding protein [Caulobacterales bacterium]